MTIDNHDNIGEERDKETQTDEQINRQKDR